MHVCHSNTYILNVDLHMFECTGHMILESHLLQKSCCITWSCHRSAGQKQRWLCSAVSRFACICCAVKPSALIASSCWPLRGAFIKSEAALAFNIPSDGRTNRASDEVWMCWVGVHVNVDCSLERLCCLPLKRICLTSQQLVRILENKSCLNDC